MRRPIMWCLLAGLLLFLWPVDFGAIHWLTLVTGAAGSALMLGALWMLRKINREFRLSFALGTAACAIRLAAVAAELLGWTGVARGIGAAVVAASALLLFRLVRAALTLRPEAEREEKRPQKAAVWCAAGGVLVWLTALFAGGTRRLVLDLLCLAPLFCAVLILYDAARCIAFAQDTPRLDRGRWGLLTGCTVLAVLTGSVLGIMAGADHLHMEMKTATESESAGDAVMRSMGVPEAVIADLSREERELCREATAIQSRQSDFPLDGGAIRLTVSAIRLPEKRYRMICHYQWLQLPRYRGADTLELTYNRQELKYVPEQDGALTQRHLTEQDGKTVEQILKTPRKGERLAIALPVVKENSRGYYAGTFICAQERPVLTNLHVQLVHRTRFLNYPHVDPLDVSAGGTAVENRKGAYEKCIMEARLNIM